MPNPSIITAQVNTTNPSCYGGNNGTANLFISGGAGGYQVNWNGEDPNFLSAGNYDVVVTDANGCYQIFNYTINNPIEVNVNSNINNVSCFGISDGSIDLLVSGGSSPYSYSWSNGDTLQDIDSLIAGNYTVFVTDSIGCVVDTSILISQPSNPLSLNAILSNVNCFGGDDGAIDVTVSGGTPFYTYVWSNLETTQDIDTLIQGTYNLTITDSNGCILDTFFVLTEPISPISIADTHVNVLCFGDSTGSIDITVLGGTPNYTYLWSNGAITQDLSNIPAGSYTVYVTDLNGCVDSLNVIVTQPIEPITITETHQNVDCFGNNDGSIDISVSGGTGSYTYVWSNNEFTQDINNLIAGTYTVYVTDSVGCTDSLEITITQPNSPLVISVFITPPPCNGQPGGSIDVSVSGGTPGYTYFWNTGQTSQDLTGIGAGVYQLSVTDDNSCVGFTVVNVTEPAQPLVVTYTETPVSCYGLSDGTILLDISGGSVPYSILWDNGETGLFIDSLSAGTYNVVVTDNNGCVVNSAATNVPQHIPTATLIPVKISGKEFGNITCLNICFFEAPNE